MSSDNVEVENGGIAPVIEVRNLTKEYKTYPSPLDPLLERLESKLVPRRLARSRGRSYCAVKDVSFSIGKGVTVGIVGRNGSGKSTLLQLICGTLNPSSGSIETTGRVAALLELGAGFNPDFTGIENIQTYASILGFKNAEIEANLESIIEFAELGEFISQPIKTYSSGMVVRLAFSVAVCLQPEILIVDEALSVGDELFQRKCFSRINEIREAGATILFVSHSSAAILELCDQAILIDRGEIIKIGTPKSVVGSYQKLLYASADNEVEIRESISLNLLDDEGSAQDHLIGPPDELVPDVVEIYDASMRPTAQIQYECIGANISGVEIQTPEGERVNHLITNKSYVYRYMVDFHQTCTKVRFGMLVKTKSGLELGGAETTTSPQFGIEVNAGEQYEVKFTFCCSLNPGVYFLNAGALGHIDGQERYLHRILDAEVFRVIEQESFSTSIVNFECEPEVELLSIRSPLPQ